MNDQKGPKKEYKIEGMSCAACARAVERAAKKVDGIKDPSVNLTTEKLTFNTENPVDEEKLFSEVKKAGYELSAIDNNREIDLKIIGMTCAACVRAVEKSISSLRGVENVSVNLTTENAKIIYDPGVVTISKIKDAVKKAGYSAEIKHSNEKIVNDGNAATAKYFKRFVFSAIFAVPLLIVAMGPMLGLTLPDIISPEFSPMNYGLLQLFLTIPVVIIGRDFYLKGIPSLFRGNPNMDTLVGLGTGAAFIYSVYSIVQIFYGNNDFAHHLYFESVGVIITLISLGKYFESLSKGKTSEAIRKLMNLTPKMALIKRDDDYISLPVEEIEVGDIILIRPGMSVPTDGYVISGNSSVDQSMLTGESIPVDVTKDSKIVGGTVNISGTVEMKATSVGSDTALSKIIKLVEDAQSSKAPIARLADIISGYFVPVVMTISVVTLITWLLLGYNFEFSLTMMIAVLVIACPCALGLATPTAIMVGSGRSAKNGILFKSGESLEQTHKINAVIFDKTGTITQGEPRVTDIIPLNGYSREEMLKLAASMAKMSSHPLDKAILSEYSGDLFKVDSFKAIPGKGIEGFIEGKKMQVGSANFLVDENIIGTVVKDLSNDGKTVIVSRYDEKITGVLGISDTIKSSSREAIELLKKRGIKTFLVTGDNEKTARAIAKKIGIDDVMAEVLPENKELKVKELMREGYKVAMVGDGINDSPALAAADIGIAVGSGTDIAIEAADVILMKNDLKDVNKAMDLSRITVRNIKQNLFWAFFYNIIGIPIAAGIFFIPFGLKLDPMIAGFAMAFSSVTVVTNALRLKKVKLSRRRRDGVK
ncbi:MAG: P-type Cu+ transporter [Kosmotogales bacterium]|nr:P-type Cu+ transporter [Kosmotogales bacterium]